MTAKDVVKRWQRKALPSTKRGQRNPLAESKVEAKAAVRRSKVHNLTIAFGQGVTIHSRLDDPASPLVMKVEQIDPVYQFCKLSFTGDDIWTVTKSEDVERQPGLWTDCQMGGSISILTTALWSATLPLNLFVEKDIIREGQYLELRVKFSSRVKNVYTITKEQR